MKANRCYEILREIVPEFFDQEYFYDYHIIEGEVLPTTFLGDLSNYFVSMVYALNEKQIDKVNRYLNCLYEFKDEEIENWIITGFLESIQPSDENYLKIKGALDIKFRKAIEHLDDVLALKKPAPENWFE